MPPRPRVAGAALLAFARGGGSVAVVGSALATRADGMAAPGGFATPLGEALQLQHSPRRPPRTTAASRQPPRPGRGVGAAPSRTTPF